MLLRKSLLLLVFLFTQYCFCSLTDIAAEQVAQAIVKNKCSIQDVESKTSRVVSSLIGIKLGPIVIKKYANVLFGSYVAGVLLGRDTIAATFNTANFWVIVVKSYGGTFILDLHSDRLVVFSGPAFASEMCMKFFGYSMDELKEKFVRGESSGLLHNFVHGSFTLRQAVLLKELCERRRLSEEADDAWRSFSPEIEYFLRTRFYDLRSRCDIL